jgi:hypothetical protein
METTETTQSEAPASPTASSDPPASTVTSKARSWLLASPEYAEFAELCERKQWKKLPTTPSDDDLKAFAATNGFSRLQLSGKFKKWKEKKESILFHSVDRSLKEEEFAVAVDVRTSFKTTATYKHAIDSEPNAVILDSEGGLVLLGQLRTDTLASINASLNASATTQVSQRSKLYSEMKQDNISSFALQWCLLAAEKYPDAAEDARASAHLIASTCLSLFHQSIMRRGTESLSSSMKVILDKSLNDAFVFPENIYHQESLYYIAGWLLCATEKEGKRRRKGSPLNIGLSQLAEESHEFDTLRLSFLPIGKVSRIQRYGKLKFVTLNFYRLVGTIEKICQGLFVDKSLVVFGPKLLVDVAYSMNHAAHLERLVEASMRPVLVDEDCRQPHAKDVLGYLVRTYLRMRGKDYVRKIMGRSKTNTTVGHRQEMAAVSNSKLRTSNTLAKEVDASTIDDANDCQAMSAIIDDVCGVSSLVDDDDDDSDSSEGEDDEDDDT